MLTEIIQVIGGQLAPRYLYSIANSSWCAVYLANRPDRRDAMIWALDYPRFYVAQGDLICHNFGIYPIVDVHMFDFFAPWQGWQMLYEPRNERGTGAEPYCDGTNRGNCQPQPLLAERGASGLHLRLELLSPAQR